MCLLCFTPVVRCAVGRLIGSLPPKKSEVLFAYVKTSDDIKYKIDNKDLPKRPTYEYHL